MKIIIALLFICSPIFADPIHFAAQRGLLSRVKNYIEKRKIPVDLPLKETGETPLILAVGSNEPKIELVHYLIQQGANINAATIDGWTALMSASQRNFTNNIMVLLSNGASPHMVTKFGENALMIAIRYQSLDAARLLLEEAPDLAWRADKNGRTPLMIATQNADSDAVSLLIEAKSPLDAVDANGYTAVMKISAVRSLAALNTLLKAGANPNIATSEGWTALMEAAIQNRPDAAIVLLKAGANPKARDRFGRTIKTLIPSQAQPNKDNDSPEWQDVLNLIDDMSL
ncbi:MAG: ankyrin repeat domain-containing protein [Brevinema sp.]